MATVNTILGPVDAGDLGFTLMHEHVRESSAGVSYTFPDLFDHDADVEERAAALNEAAAEGVRSNRGRDHDGPGPGHATAEGRCR